MRKFKDKTGAEWELEIDFAMREQIVEVSGIDIIDIKEDQAAGDMRMFERGVAVQLAEAMLASKFAEQQLSPKDFRQRLNGAALDGLCLAVWGAFEDFFLSTAKYRAAALTKVVETVLEGDAAAASKISAVPTSQILAQPLERMDQALASALAAGPSDGA